MYSLNNKHDETSRKKTEMFVFKNKYILRYCVHDMIASKKNR